MLKNKTNKKAELRASLMKILLWIFFIVAAIAITYSIINFFKKLIAG